MIDPANSAPPIRTGDEEESAQPSRGHGAIVREELIPPARRAVRDARRMERKEVLDELERRAHGALDSGDDLRTLDRIIDSMRGER